MNVAEEAAQKVSGPRQETYGDCRETARRIALVWSAILGTTVHPWQVPLMMAGLKLVRAGRNPGHRDNLVDGCGYLLNAETIGGDAWSVELLDSLSEPDSQSSDSPLTDLFRRTGH